MYTKVYDSEGIVSYKDANSNLVSQAEVDLQNATCAAFAAMPQINAEDILRMTSDSEIDCPNSDINNKIDSLDNDNNYLDDNYLVRELTRNDKDSSKTKAFSNSRDDKNEESASKKGQEDNTSLRTPKKRRMLQGSYYTKR